MAAITDFFNGIGGGGGFGAIANMLYVFFMALIGFGGLVTLWYFLWYRFRKFPIKATIQIPTQNGGYLEAYDRIGYLTKKGVQKVIMEKDKKAIVPTSAYNFIQRDIKGKPIIYLRKIDEVTYVPLSVNYHGKEIDFKPLPLNVRNIVARSIIEDAKQFTIIDAITKYAQPILYGLLIMGLIVTTVINSKTLDKATTVASEINSKAYEQGEQITKNQRETASAMARVADMLQKVCGDRCSNLESSTGLTPTPLPSLPLENTAGNDTLTFEGEISG